MKIKTSTPHSHATRWSLGLLASLACTYASADVIAGTGIPSATTLGQRTATQLVGEQAGIGHALIVPYYSTQNGNVSVFSITNTDLDNGKAIKVRVRGAGNGDSLLSLTVLIGPGDVWNATLRQGANSVAELVTYDATCAVPRVAAGVARPLSTSRLDNAAWSDADKANQTREGYVEILSMADIPRTSPTSALFDAIRRIADPATPCAESLFDATAVFGAVGNANHTTEAGPASMGLAAPTSGIAGKWLIINAPETTTFAGSMFALRAVDANGKDARANFVLFPQTDAAYTGAIDNVTSDPLLRSVAYTSKTGDGLATGATTKILAAAMHDLPDLSTPYVAAPGSNAALSQAASLSLSMAVKRIQNEYATEPTLAAKTDWILSSPARRYSLGMDYAASSPRTLFSMVPATGKQYFHASSSGPRKGDFPTQVCWRFPDARFFNRDTSSGGRSSPLYPNEESIGLCGAVTLVNMIGVPDDGASAVKGSVVRQTATGLINGWARLSSVDAETSLGMPVIGSAFIRFYNPSVSAGISGNYGITFDHWMKR